MRYTSDGCRRERAQSADQLYSGHDDSLMNQRDSPRDGRKGYMPARDPQRLKLQYGWYGDIALRALAVMVGMEVANMNDGHDGKDRAKESALVFFRVSFMVDATEKGHNASHAPLWEFF